MHLEINIHPWIDGLWVVTVNGQIICPPCSRRAAEQIVRKL